MNTEVDRVVERLFPSSLLAIDDFEDWCARIREAAQPGAADLVALLKQQLDSEKSACHANCPSGRDCWELFGGEGDNAIKSARSIRSKLARDLMGEPVTIPKVTEAFLRDKVLQFGDLGRVRIIADFPSDIANLRSNLFRTKKFLGTYKCPKGIKDFVFDPKMRNGLKGHRAFQFSVRVPFDGTYDFGFEVQLMTRLQHAWDRRNHPLYEWQREKPDWLTEPEAVELAVNDFACAEALHLVDRQADENWHRLQNLLKTRKS